MRRAVLLIGLGLSGCAFHHAVQRMAVDYNATVAGMANEVTVLNIVRAKEAMPLQYTGFNRISGSISASGELKANAALKETGVTTENGGWSASRPTAGRSLIRELSLEAAIRSRGLPLA